MKTIFKTDNAVQRLKEESSKILNVFTKTVENLEKLNQSIQDEVVQRTDKIKSLEEDIVLLQKEKENNTNIVNSLKSFFIFK